MYCDFTVKLRVLFFGPCGAVFRIMVIQAEIGAIGSPCLRISAHCCPNLPTKVGLPVAGCSCENNCARIWITLVETANDLILGWVFEDDWIDSRSLRRALDRLIVHVVVTGDWTVLTEEEKPR